ncbi:hypothetical protein FBY05_112141 [Pseudomonas sp. SJZ083]|nr:hypothetical protein FBY05_112141 [Pseudomonas sp. SJZ083]TWC46080.1 hypothetical protein FBY01_112141 [Pseudomonas sp. SJZ077]
MIEKFPTGGAPPSSRPACPAIAEGSIKNPSSQPGSFYRLSSDKGVGSSAGGTSSSAAGSFQSSGRSASAAAGSSEGSLPGGASSSSVGSSVPGMGLVGSVLGVPPWSIESFAMTHLTDEVQKIRAVLVGSGCGNSVLSTGQTVVRHRPKTGRGCWSGAATWRPAQRPDPGV